MCKAYRESPSQDVHLLARLVLEIRTAIKDIAFRLTLFMLTCVREESKLEEIGSNLRKFWEVEAVNKSEPVLGIKDRVAMEKVKNP